jgi:hypothetical protein
MVKPPTTVPTIKGEPTVTLTDGALTLGHVFERGSEHVATDAQRHRLGSFASQAEAVRAIHQARQS